MKKIAILLITAIFFGNLSLRAQSFQDVVAAESDIELDEICKSVLGLLDTPREIDEAINEIVRTAGLTETVFKLRQCSNIENAIAKIITEDGKDVRYIIYDGEFIKRLINETSSEWSGKFVLAHEIGHHLYGHSLNNGTSTHQYELEADFFAGRALSILGASLEQTLSATSILPERASSTHPARAERIEKTKEGWNSYTNKARTIKVKQEDVDEIALTIVGEAKKELSSSNITKEDYSRILQGLNLARTKYYNGYTEDIRFYEALCFEGLGDEESAMESYINYLSIENLDNQENISQIAKLFVVSNSKKSSYFTNPKVLYRITKAYYDKDNYDKVIDYGKQYLNYNKEDSSEKSEINKLVGLSEYKRLGTVKVNNSDNTENIDEIIARGESYYANQEYNKSFEAFKTAAGKNNPKAQYYLGQQYYAGFGVEKNTNTALDYFLKSAQQGYGYAQLGAGYLYFQNAINGATEDYDKATFWLSKAQEQNIEGASEALSQIKVLNRNKSMVAVVTNNTEPDRTVNRSETKDDTGKESIARNMIQADSYFDQEMYRDAFEHYQTPAKNGDPKALFRVGWMYYKGKGISKDKNKAVDWWRLAAKKGNIDAINYLTRLGKW